MSICLSWRVDVLKFNWKMFVAILLMILLIGCDKSTNEENDNINETGKDNQGVEKNGDNNKVSEAFSPEDFIEVLLDGNYLSIYNQMSETFQSQITIEELEDIAEDFNRSEERRVGKERNYQKPLNN